ncbi:XdhC family protein [Marinobacterium rhizophilum]|uniref:XdhC family protein n=1 Tax=Marinobacterium rhizophilum TaxID=420402 RepID=A0ABY5HNZ4_9GAMM|nr:XdhC/CoxI family protein [Marinobacterium rhizophilum]UTW14033.1 XdhC family protein [Marinobacterium rhizophilum]
MANDLSHLLQQWYPERDSADWVLGTVYRTEGPCYRKPGATMLFNSLGQQFGLLSGGCLESDIHRHARQVMHSHKAVTLCYDGSDEDDLSYQLGIGCGGTVHILLQPVLAQQQYLQLDAVHQALGTGRDGLLYQRIPDNNGQVESRFMAATPDTGPTAPISRLITEGEQQWLVTRIRPAPHLLIAGGGLDARPLASMAHQLGWRTSLWDPRPANARREHFPSVDRIIQTPADGLDEYARAERVDAAVLMTHNIGLDAAVLETLNSVPLRYCALLGPHHRRAQVLHAAGLSETQLTTPVAGPAGLDIGAELPESIALAILAECHAQLHQRSVRPLSQPA